MALVPMKQMLIDARREHRAIGGFVFWSLESAKAIVDASQERNLPAILQAAPPLINFLGVKNVQAFVTSLANDADIPIALHLDHGMTLDDVKQALDHGFTSVMMDSSSKDFEENVTLTAQTVELAQKYGASVEAELGHVGGFEFPVETFSEEERLQTNPGQAKSFIEQTGIDCLAVAIGTVHGFYKFKPKLNLEKLKQIEQIVEHPLVLHGGSGTPTQELQEAIRHGIAKINIFTEMFAGAARSYQVIQNRPGYELNIFELLYAPYKTTKKICAERMDQFNLRKV